MLINLGYTRVSSLNSQEKAPTSSEMGAKAMAKPTWELQTIGGGSQVDWEQAGGPKEGTI